MSREEGWPSASPIIVTEPQDKGREERRRPVVCCPTHGHFYQIVACPECHQALKQQLDTLTAQVETLREKLRRAHAALDAAQLLMAGCIDAILPVARWQGWTAQHRQALADDTTAAVLPPVSEKET